MKMFYRLSFLAVLNAPYLGAVASCLSPFESSAVKFEEIPEKESPIVKLVATFPKDAGGWPLEWVSFSYSLNKGRHLILTKLEYKHYKDGYISTVKYNSEHSEAVTLEVLYQDPNGACGKVAAFIGAEPA